VTEETTHVNSIAPLKNVTLMNALVERVMNRSAGLPGMATFHGFSGYGKTSAATYVAAKHRCYHIQVKSVWTPKKLCLSILQALGIEPARTIADMVDQIGEELALSGRPLLVDEADFLVQKRMVEVVRDIYESSAAAIILIGEEHLPGKLKAWERVHGRMLDWVAAQPASLPDAKHLAGLYCPGIDIDDGLLTKLHEASAGSARRICVNLDRIRELARTQGLDRVGPTEWGARSFFQGTPPHARRMSA
jgi:DNA transposition AAA+ family ATPase